MTRRPPPDEEAPRITRRGLMLLGIQAGVVGTIGWRIRDLQIIQNAHYRTLAEENAFTHDGTAWACTLPSTLQLPAGMSDLVGRRLNRLSPEALRILVTAAAIGRTFPVGLLAEYSVQPRRATCARGLADFTRPS